MNSCTQHVVRFFPKGWTSHTNPADGELNKLQDFRTPNTIQQHLYVNSFMSDLNTYMAFRRVWIHFNMFLHNRRYDVFDLFVICLLYAGKQADNEKRFEHQCDSFILRLNFIFWWRSAPEAKVHNYKHTLYEHKKYWEFFTFLSYKCITWNPEYIPGRCDASFITVQKHKGKTQRGAYTQNWCDRLHSHEWAWAVSSDIMINISLTSWWSLEKDLSPGRTADSVLVEKCYRRKPQNYQSISMRCHAILWSTMQILWHVNTAVIHLHSKY